MSSQEGWKGGSSDPRSRVEAQTGWLATATAAASGTSSSTVTERCIMMGTHSTSRRWDTEKHAWTVDIGRDRQLSEQCQDNTRGESLDVIGRPFASRTGGTGMDELSESLDDRNTVNKVCCLPMPH